MVLKQIDNMLPKSEIFCKKLKFMILQISVGVHPGAKNNANIYFNDEN